MILVIPWLGFTKWRIAGITIGLIITGEVLFYLSLFILGRSYYDKIKSKLKFWKSKPSRSEPIEQGQQEMPQIP
jgi:multisubunit Na+/H+ antiporter MnhE subunit